MRVADEAFKRNSKCEWVNPTKEVLTKGFFILLRIGSCHNHTQPGRLTIQEKRI